MTAISKSSCDHRQDKRNCVRRNTEQLRLCLPISRTLEDGWGEVRETANDDSIAERDHGHVEDVWLFESRDDSLDRNLGVLF
jgi:hypothetical protein